MQKGVKDGNVVELHLKQFGINKGINKWMEKKNWTYELV